VLGGKSLAIAATTGNKGQIAARDVSARRLEATGQRLRRAGVFNVERTSACSDERDKWVKKHALARTIACSSMRPARERARGGANRRALDAARGGIAELAANSAASSKWRRLAKGDGSSTRPARCWPRRTTQADAFAAASADFTVLPVPGILEGTPAAPVPRRAGPYLTLNPACYRTDGFFLAAFVRNG
jgi:16S rRNA (cytosine967-C5)-methyltransferase